MKCYRWTISDYEIGDELKLGSIIIPDKRMPRTDIRKIKIFYWIEILWIPIFILIGILLLMIGSGEIKGIYEKKIHPFEIFLGILFILIGFFGFVFSIFLSKIYCYIYEDTCSCCRGYYQHICIDPNSEEALYFTEVIEV